MKSLTTEQRGYAQVFLGAAVWGAIGFFVMALAERGASAAMTSFLRSFFATILMFFMTGLYCGFRCFRVQGKTLYKSIIQGRVSLLWLLSKKRFLPAKDG